ncbi:hypothetical protein IQ13_3074 [Lacibacter cauensis]|uniref:Uncharacterized protein n=1 Tax=Lacibacter cauensis TaxID=510947 RepID=A0A562SGF3_9BACT|nr:hypothetical protein [Lacibacter cauensis]TWI80397.1 hypothetical protein IQ13_3074 [Lacibacter cauensis]
MFSDVDFLERLEILLDQPGMFNIQRVEDIQMIFTAEIHINRNESVGDWSLRFSRFVIEDCNTDLQNFDWSRIIRLYSGSDAHSIDLFKTLVKRFSESQVKR